MFRGIVTPFVIPTSVIFLSVGCTLLVSFIISIFAFIKIRRIAPMEAIRKNLNSNKKVKKSNFIISKLSKNISALKVFL